MGLKNLFGLLTDHQIQVNEETKVLRQQLNHAVAGVMEATAELEAVITGFRNDYRLLKTFVVREMKTMGIIPMHWMPPAKMKRIIVHWTAGGPKATKLDLSHYHFVINQDMEIVPGVPIPLNEKQGIPGYAAHTKNCNTGSIGFSLAGMLNAESRFVGGQCKLTNPGPHPIVELQWTRAMLAIAALAQNYQIDVTPETILTHAEVQHNLGIKQNGKWDIAVLPWQKETFDSAKKCGDLMRAEVKHIIENGPPVQLE